MIKKFETFYPLSKTTLFLFLLNKTNQPFTGNRYLSPYGRQAPVSFQIIVRVYKKSV